MIQSRSRKYLLKFEEAQEPQLDSGQIGSDKLWSQTFLMQKVHASVNVSSSLQPYSRGMLQ